MRSSSALPSKQLSLKSVPDLRRYWAKTPSRTRRAKLGQIGRHLWGLWQSRTVSEARRTCRLPCTLSRAESGDWRRYVLGSLSGVLKTSDDGCVESLVVRVRWPWRVEGQNACLEARRASAAASAVASGAHRRWCWSQGAADASRVLRLYLPLRCFRAQSILSLRPTLASLGAADSKKAGITEGMVSTTQC